MGIFFSPHIIAGHSGTEFKNKKAFVKQKKFLKYYKQNDNRKNILNHPYFIYKTNRFSTIVLKAFGIIVLACLIYGLFKFTNNQINVLKDYDKIEALSCLEDLNYTLQFNLINGQYHLENLNLPSAKEQFELALALEPRNKHALTGLTKTLLAQCLYQNLFCKESETYLAFMNAHFPSIKFDLYQEAVVKERIEK